MALKVTKESDELARETAERCVFCRVPTRHWHTPTNNPVCPACAKRRTVRDFAAAPIQQADELKE